jgi:RHS repeat-associated protein
VPRLNGEASASVCGLPGEELARWVGDPVDVISGVHADVALDFRIPAAFPFEWRRYYSTARLNERLPLGWGHTHSYDHRLNHAVDGLLYVDPNGGRHLFPLAARATSCATATGTLRRAGDSYHVKVGGFPECVFRFTDRNQPARLVRLVRARDSHELSHTPDGRLRSITLLGTIVLVDSDEAGRVVALQLDEGNQKAPRVVWQGSYDAAGNLSRVVDPYQKVQTFSYDTAHRVTRRTDRRGYAFEFAYDAQGRCVRSAGEDRVGEVLLQHLPEQALTKVTRPDGGEWQHFYENGRVAKLIDPYGGARSWTYDARGRLEREVGPMGEVVQVVSDEESGLLDRPLEPSGGMTLLLGDPWFSHVRAIRLPRDAMAWDGWGEGRCRNMIRLPFRESDWLRALPPIAARAFRTALGAEDAPGPPPTTVGAKRIGVPDRPGRYQFDAFGQLASHTDLAGHTARWQYDGNGNITRAVDYAGSEWRKDYASWNHCVAETDPLGNVTRHAYSLVEQKVRTTDPGGTTTEWRYDLKDRLLERRRHGEARDEYAYDASDGVTASSSFGALRATLTHGINRRPLETRITDGRARAYSYDAKGRLVAIEESGGDKLEFAYAVGGLLTADLRNGRGVTRRHAAGGVAELTVLERFATRYEREPAKREATIVDPLGGRHVFRQIDLGVFSRRFPNGVTELAQYDWSGRCLAKVSMRTDQPRRAWARRFAYSGVGALTSVQDSARGESKYRYDATSRLVAEVGPDQRERGYRYDPAGNLLDAPSLEAAVYSENRLLRERDRSFEHDARGNLVRESGAGVERRYAWDSEDQLVECWLGGQTTRFEYDALGRRTSKRSAGGESEYIWDGERLAAEIAPDGQLRVYLYGDGVGLTPFAFIDYASVEAEPTSGVRRYVSTNQIGCPQRVEDDAGRVLWQAEIEPYGRATIAAGASLTFNLRWPGHYFDPETELHYNRHRYYSPALCRYIQVDPRDLEGGLNVYAATPRPLDTVDVDGLAPCPQKAMIPVDEDDPDFQQAKKQADEISDDLKKAMAKAVEKKEMHPLNAAGTTLTTMVVVDKDGNYVVVVTGNRSDAGLPQRVLDAMGDNRYIAHGDDRPPPVRATDSDSRFGRDNPRTGDREPSTHNHAEQRGLRATDCDPNTQGVAYIAPTRPCCEGCSKSIQSRSGSNSNVSNQGRQPGPHGNWWD